MASSIEFTEGAKAAKTYLDQTSQHPEDARYKQAFWEMASGGFRGPIHVLDVGCGNGHELIMRAPNCATGSKLMGVDTNPSLLAVATANAETLDDSHRPLFKNVDVMQLAGDLEVGSYDLVRTDRVLLHLADPDTAIMSMLGMVRSGGILAIADSDFASLRFSESSCPQQDTQVVGAIRTVYASALRHPRMAINALSGLSGLVDSGVVKSLQHVWWTIHLDTVDDAMSILRLGGDEGILKTAIANDYTNGDDVTNWERRMRELEENDQFHAKFEMAMMVAMRT